jgi:uncharacterized protein YgiM (DUF1202 family)
MRRISSILVAAVCLILAAGPAFAFGKIMYSDRPLNLRDARSPKGEWVGSLYAGQKVRVAHEKDGWVAVYEPDATDPSESKAAGYSNAKFLKPKRDRYEPKEWGELVVSSTKLNIRSKPSVRGTKVRTLQPGERVLVDFPEDDWTVVFSSDATIRSRLNGIGYASTKYLEPVTAATPPAPEPEPAPSAPVVRQAVEPPAQAPAMEASGTSPVIQRVALTNEVNVHQSRTTTSPLVQTLRPGDVVQLGLLRNGWYAVFKASDMIRSESSSIGYALQTAMRENSREAGIAVAPATPVEPAKSASAAAPVVSAEDLKAEALKAERPAPPAPEPAPSAKPEPAPAPAPAARPAPEPARQQTMVIDRSAFKDVKRPDPTPDQNAHGYRYKFLEKSETREYGQVWISLKVFLATTKLPDRTALKDFASSLWKEHRRVTKNVLVEIYLPGMDLEDLAWGVVKFDYDGMTELWTRQATLFGTKFM